MPGLSPAHSVSVSDMQTQPPVFQCVPTGSVLPGNTTEKSLAPSALQPPSRYLPREIRYPLSLLWAKLSSQPFAPSSSLCPFTRCCPSSVSISPLPWEAQCWDSALQVLPHHCWAEQKKPLLHSAGSTLLTQHQSLLLARMLQRHIF